MGFIRTTERRIKRLLIRGVTATFRVTPVAVSEILARPPRRILVVRQHHQMGDMLLAVPAYRAIKETFPDAEIGVVCAPINRGVLANPYVRYVHTFKGYNPFRLLPLLREVRGAHYDLCIVLHTVSFSFTSAILGRFSGARYRVGSTSRPFGHSLAAALYHLELPLPEPDAVASMNEAEHNLYPLRVLGIDTHDLRPEIVPSAVDEAWAAQWVSRREGRFRIAVHPGAGKVGNIWPPERFADVVNRLGSDRSLDLYVVEGPRDRETARRFRDAVCLEATPVRARTIGEVAALLARMDLVICNDTGVMHVAAACGARTLSVFGPTDPIRWAPRCPNLHVLRAPDGRLEDLDVVVVYEAAARLAEGVSSSGEGSAGTRNADAVQ